LVARTACYYDDPIRLAGLADRAGAYRLEIGTCETEQITGNYQAIVVENRPATTNDDARVAATQASIEADKLRAELNIAANREAVQKYQTALQLWRTAAERMTEAATLRNIGEMLQTRGERVAGLRYLKQA